MAGRVRHGASSTKGLSQKEHEAPQVALNGSHTRNPRTLGFEHLWGRPGDAVDSEPLLQGMGWVPGSVPDDVHAKTLRTLLRAGWGWGESDVSVLTVWWGYQGKRHHHTARWVCHDRQRDAVWTQWPLTWASPLHGC